MDIGGPHPKHGIRGERYHLALVDDFSGMGFYYPLRTKDEVLEKLVDHIARVERQQKRKLQKIRTDGWRRVCEQRLQALCSTQRNYT